MSKNEARQLRVEAYNDENGRIPFPIDPFTIARNLGINVEIVPLDPDTAGFILKESFEDKPTIYLNVRDGFQRRRFTLAHELGHFVKHRGAEEIAYVDNRDELASRGTDPNERWCNAFAAELLMPEAIVKKDWALGKSVEEMRRKFDVSMAAMTVRLSSLGLVR